ncbi:MAG TPA: hypothetical protein DCF63_11680 [Planctomycetaceae bacterium]|nr:hypothetical protein [Planctomycetaceae bacterium]
MALIGTESKHSAFWRLEVSSFFISRGGCRQGCLHFCFIISTTAEYVPRAVVLLAKHQDRLTGRAEIAAATCIPLDYSLKVLNALDAAGIVRSKRDPGGGYQSVRAANQLTTLEVVQAGHNFGIPPC